MRMQRAALGTGIAAMAMLLPACGGDEPFPGDGLPVAVTLAPVEELVRRVGGDAVEVANLVPGHADPHDLELTPGQADALAAAEVAVVIGAGFQPAVEAAAAEREGTTVVLAERAGGGNDPHVWLDPALMAELTTVVEEALAAAAPEQAAGFASRADAYRAELALLDETFARDLADCERRTFVAAHAAFGRLAERYDLEQLAIAGVSTHDEPSPERVAELAAAARRAGVTTIFTEPLGSRALAETIADEAGGLQVATLDPIETFGEDDDASYGSIMRDNLVALQRALGCRTGP